MKQETEKKAAVRKKGKPKGKHPGPNQKIGQTGENTACRYLTGQGYRILERNFRTRSGEIDIVTLEVPERENGGQETAVLVFFEVKTRRSLTYGVPALAVTKTKQKHLLSAADYYRHLHKLYEYPVRYDVLEVLILDGNQYIRHIRNAFS